LGIFIFFALPLFGRTFSLIYYKNKISPQKWLTIYLILVVLYVIGAIGSGFVNHTRDLPMAIRRDFATIEGEVQIVRNNNSYQRILVFNEEFNLNRRYFYNVSRNNTYRIIYLPNSRHIIDIINEEGRSLLRRRN